MSKSDTARALRAERALGIIQCRDTGMTYKEIGIKYNISTSRVQQITHWIVWLDGINLDNPDGYTGSSIRSIRIDKEQIKIARQELNGVKK